MITIGCDVCAAKVEGEPTRLAIMRPGEADYRPDIDLCGCCAARLLEWLYAGPASPARPPTAGRTI